MKKLLLGFIAIGLLVFIGCDKDDDTETTDSTETSSDDGSTDTDSGDGTTDTSSDEAIDADGNTYKSVTIGEQEWFAENLRTTKYNDGSAILNVKDDYNSENSTIGSWCHYENDNQYDTIYGKLYNWYAVNTSKLCPTGWHVPTDAEWTVLTNYLADWGAIGTEGTALKANSGWYDDGNGTDDYGWLGLPGGGRWGMGSFSAIGIFGYWWSSSQNSAINAWNRYLYYDGGLVSRGTSSKHSVLSVRCLRD